MRFTNMFLMNAGKHFLNYSICRNRLSQLIKKRRKSFTYCMSIILFACGQQCFAQLEGSISWVGTTDGNWHEPANWDLGRVPNSNDQVVIDLADDDIIITISYMSLQI